MGTFSTDITLFLSFFRSRVQSSDFSDITNWPTPGEIANKEVRKTLHFNINLTVLYAILFNSRPLLFDLHNEDSDTLFYYHVILMLGHYNNYSFLSMSNLKLKSSCV